MIWSDDWYHSTVTVNGKAISIPVVLESRMITDYSWGFGSLLHVANPVTTVQKEK